MAGKPIAMHHLRELILHFQRGVSIKESCRRLRISRNTVRRYRQQLAGNMDRLDDLLAMEQPELHAWFHPPQPETTDVDRYTDLVSRTPTIIAELRRKGVTRYLLWVEYRQDYVEGYGYSQFCYYLRQAAKQIDVSMVQHFVPGEVIFFDFAGHTMDVIDPYTGEVSPRQIFLATAGYSHLTFAMAVPRQTVPCLIEAIESALQFYGGAPQSLVCDNLKAAVTRPDRYEPVINEVLADLAAHYNVALMPARVCKPRDKSRVEASVKFFYQRVMAPLRNRAFHSDHDLNVAIAEHMTASNATPMQRQGVSRRELFDKAECETLQPLPEQRFELKWRKSLMAQKNNHIFLSVDKTYYSLPYIHVGQRVAVIYTATLVSIYAKGKLVATHRRTHLPNSYCTTKEHMPPPHQAMLERHVQTYLHWAEATKALDIYTVVLRILHGRRFVQQSYKSCDGIKALYREYGAESMKLACSAALELDRCSYRFLRNYLKANPTPATSADDRLRAIPKHGNIRGASSYQ